MLNEPLKATLLLLKARKGFERIEKEIAEPATGWPDDFEKKFSQFFQKVAKTVSKPQKCQNNYIKAQFENPKQIYQTLLNLKIPATNHVLKLPIYVKM